MLDIDEVYNQVHNQLIKYRTEFSKNEYPYYLSISLVVDYITSEKVFELLITKKNHDENVNYSMIEALIRYTRRRIASKELIASVKKEINNFGTIRDLNVRSLIERVKKAINGDNKEVEEIEFLYSCFMLTRKFIDAWLAYIAIGYSSFEAYIKLTDDYDLILISDFDSLNNVELTFKQHSMIYLSGLRQKNGDLVIGTKNYIELPPLW